MACMARIEASGDIRSGRLVKELQIVKELQRAKHRLSPRAVMHPTDLDRLTVWHRSTRLVNELQIAMHEDNNRWSPADKSTIYEVHPTDVDRWIVWLAGPAEGPYSAGVWELSVTFPPEYPCRPPTIFFVTPIYHPFVCQTSGKVAGLLDEKTWSPALQMRVILYSLHSMLVDVKVKADAFKPCWSENKLMQSMIQQLKSDRADYDRVARKWTQAHATGASHFLPGHPSCACFSPAIRRRARYLMWVARQLEALHGDALLDPWVEFIVPLCVFVPDKTEKEADDLPNEESDDIPN